MWSRIGPSLFTLVVTFLALTSCNSHLSTNSNTDAVVDELTDAIANYDFQPLTVSLDPESGDIFVGNQLTYTFSGTSLNGAVIQFKFEKQTASLDQSGLIETDFPANYTRTPISVANNQYSEIRNAAGFFKMVFVFVSNSRRYAAVVGFEVKEESSGDYSTAVSRDGITWTFDSPVLNGTFVNGDPWIVGPAEVVSIDPPPVDGRNGSWLNPYLTGSSPFDSRTPYYDGSIGSKPPINLSVGDILISTRSVENFDCAIGGKDGKKDVLGGCSIKSKTEVGAPLTVLGSEPATGSFRPAILGDHQVKYNMSSFDLSSYPSLNPVANAPNIDNLLDIYSGLHMTFGSNWQAVYMKFLLSQPGYYREAHRSMSDAILATLMNGYPADKREKLIVALIQLGIDHQGAAHAAGTGPRDLMHAPILLAAHLLGASELFNAGSSGDFKTDYQTYACAPWWGNDGHPFCWQQHADSDPANKFEEDHPTNWHDPVYEAQSGSQGACKQWSYKEDNSKNWVGMALWARLAGLESVWNQPNFFGYVKRQIFQDFSQQIAVIRQPDACGSGASDWSGNVGSAFVQDMLNVHGW